MLAKSRMEGEPEQAPLAAGPDPVAEVQERLLDERALLEDQDPARLLDHEQPAAAVARIGDEHRLPQPVDDQLQVDPGLGRRRAATDDADQRETTDPCPRHATLPQFARSQTDLFDCRPEV